MLPPVLVIAIPSMFIVGSVWGRISSIRSAKVKRADVWDPVLREEYEKLMVGIPDFQASQIVIQKLKKAGRKDEMKRLQNRIKIASLSPEVQERRRVAVKQALQSTDLEKVTAFAQALDNEGAHETAQMLREYAQGLK